MDEGRAFENRLKKYGREFEELKRNNSTAASFDGLVRDGIPEIDALKAIAVQLAEQLKASMEEISYLSSIAPRIIDDQNGKRYRWDAPSEDTYRRGSWRRCMSSIADVIEEELSLLTTQGE